MKKRGDELNCEPVAALGRERIAARTSAYVYGNVLALSALTASAHPGGILGGQALRVLLATGVMTLLAHWLAHHLANVVKFGDVQARADIGKELREEARDSLPIATSVGGPGLFLLGGALGWVDELVAMNLAIGCVMVRMLFLGTLVAHFGAGKRAPLSAIGLGVGFALFAAAIALAKTWLTH